MFISDIGKYAVTLGTPWMKKHGVVIDAALEQIYFKRGIASIAEHPIGDHGSAWSSFNNQHPYRGFHLETERPSKKMIDFTEKLPRITPSNNQFTKAENPSLKKVFTRPIKITILKPDESTISQKVKKVKLDPLQSKTIKPKISTPSKNENKQRDYMDIAMVGEASYNWLAKKKDAEVFATSMKNINDPKMIRPKIQCTLNKIYHLNIMI